MGTESFGKALKAIVNDADAASTIATGDFAALPDHDLTPTEQAMLQAAASEIPEVSGFSIQLLKLGYVGETEKNLTSIQGQFGPRFSEAADYFRAALRD